MKPLLITIGFLNILIPSVIPWVTIAPEDLLKKDFDKTQNDARKLKTRSRVVYQLHGHSKDNHDKTALHDALMSRKLNDSKAAQRILHSKVAWHDLLQPGNHLDINEAKITRSYNNEQQNDLLKPQMYFTGYTEGNVKSLNRNNPGLYVTDNDRRIYNQMFLGQLQAPQSNDHHEASEAIYYAPFITNEGGKTPRKRFKIRYNRKIRFHHRPPVNPQPTLVQEFHNHLVHEADVSTAKYYANIDRGNEYDLVTESLKNVNVLPLNDELRVYNNQVIIPVNNDGKDQSTFAKEKLEERKLSDVRTVHQVKSESEENHIVKVSPKVLMDKELVHHELLDPEPIIQVSTEEETSSSSSSDIPGEATNVSTVVRSAIAERSPSDTNVVLHNEKHGLDTTSVEHANVLTLNNDVDNLKQRSKTFSFNALNEQDDAIQGEKDYHKEIIIPGIYHGKYLSSFDEERSSSDVTAENQVESDDKEIVKLLPDLISKETVNPGLFNIEQVTHETPSEETGVDEKTDDKVISEGEVKFSGENISSVEDTPSTGELAGVAKISDGVKLSKTLCKITEKLLSGDKKALNIWIKVLNVLNSNIASRNGAIVSKNLAGSKEPVDIPAKRNEDITNFLFDYLNETVKNNISSQIFIRDNESPKLNTEQLYSKFFDIKASNTPEETQNEMIDKVNQHSPLGISVQSLKPPEIDIKNYLATKGSSTTPPQLQNRYLPLQISLRTLKHPDIDIIDYLESKRPSTTPPELQNRHYPMQISIRSQKPPDNDIDYLMTNRASTSQPPSMYVRGGRAQRKLNPHLEIFNDYSYDDLEPSNDSGHSDNLKHILGNLNSKNSEIGEEFLLSGHGTNKGEDKNVIKPIIGERKKNLNETKGSEVSDALGHQTKEDMAEELSKKFFATFGSPKGECFEEVQKNLMKELKYVIANYINHQDCNTHK